ncbi:MAG: 2TM domain-containing protein [Armatimonadetes bacterium]|nr:2TM domain-containing protein [Armatimonadota bacterium]
MADQLDPIRSEDDVEEILRLAVRHDLAPGSNLRDRLQSSADELGISPEVLAMAEQEWAAKKNADLELANEAGERKRYMRIQFAEFIQHLGLYAVINGFLFWLDISKDGRINWAYWPLMGWGIAVALHAISLVARGESEEKDFQKWRRKQRRYRG